MNPQTTSKNAAPRTSAKAGFVRHPVLIITTLCALAGIGGYAVMRAEMNTQQCVQNLRHIYLALELHEIDHGKLPHLAFYPDDAWHSPDSMLVVLDPYAITSEIGICPTSHEIVQQKGLSYIWNANLNGKKLHEQKPDTWLVSKLSSLSDQVPSPHLGGYVTLYADGRIERSRRPPAGLTDVRP